MSYTISSLINANDEFNRDFAFTTDNDEEMREVEELQDASESDTDSSDSENVEHQAPQAHAPKVHISPAKAPLLARIFKRPINPAARFGDLARLHGFLSDTAVPEYARLETRDQMRAKIEQLKAFGKPNDSQEQLECREKEKQYRDRQEKYANQRAAVSAALGNMEQLLAKRERKEENYRLKLQEQNSIPLAGQYISPFKSFTIQAEAMSQNQ
jgi:hypothetical protein